MDIDESKPFHIGYAWEDGPTDAYDTEEEAMAVAAKWKHDEPNSTIYVWKLLKVFTSKKEKELQKLVAAYREAMLAYSDKYGSFLPLREKALEMDEKLSGHEWNGAVGSKQ